MIWLNENIKLIFRAAGVQSWMGELNNFFNYLICSTQRRICMSLQTNGFFCSVQCRVVCKSEREIQQWSCKTRNFHGSSLMIVHKTSIKVKKKAWTSHTFVWKCLENAYQQPHFIPSADTARKWIYLSLNLKNCFNYRRSCLCSLRCSFVINCIKLSNHKWIESNR